MRSPASQSSFWVNLLSFNLLDLGTTHLASRPINRDAIRRGAFRDVDDLECTILEANDILAKTIRARAAQKGLRISGNLP